VQWSAMSQSGAVHGLVAAVAVVAQALIVGHGQIAVPPRQVTRQHYAGGCLFPCWPFKASCRANRSDSSRVHWWGWRGSRRFHSTWYRDCRGQQNDRGCPSGVVRRAAWGAMLAAAITRTLSLMSTFTSPGRGVWWCACGVAAVADSGWLP
jgi:hypothetical protein